MPELVCIVPSRERPGQARALVQNFAHTCTTDTQLLFAVDDNDPTRGEYPEGTVVLPSRSMGEALNLAAADVAQDAFAIAFMGDDHCPRTYGWDEKYLSALHELGSGIVYGDDLLQGKNLPTQLAMTADIVRELGYMVPPSLVHLYMDNFWLTLGRAAACLQYLPEVVVEHVHSFAGKAAMDAGYERVNDQAMYDRDKAAFEAYCRESLAGDIAKVRALRGARV